MNNCNGAHEQFMHKAQQLFAERGFEKVDSESTRNGEFLLFTYGQISHLVYCLPSETYVTTIEIQACLEAQHRLGADSSSVVAPYQFSAVPPKAQSLAIEFLGV
jgi:hypothetical protein